MEGKADAQASGNRWFCGCIPLLQSFRRNPAPRRGKDSLAEPNELSLTEPHDEEGDPHPLYAAKLLRKGAPTPETIRADRVEAKAVTDLWASIRGKVCSLTCGGPKITSIRALLPSGQQR